MSYGWRWMDTVTNLSPFRILPNRLGRGTPCMTGMHTIQRDPGVVGLHVRKVVAWPTQIWLSRS